MKIRYTPRSLRDLSRIWQTIAEDNPRAADRVEATIRKRIDGLKHHPGTGVPLDYGNARRIPLSRYPYTIYYRVDDVADAVDILRIVPSAQIRDLGQVP